MATKDTIPSDLWTAVDGFDIHAGFGRTCRACQQEYQRGERIIVIAERQSNAAGWAVTSIVCSECGQRSLSDDDRKESVEQALVSAELAAAGMTLVLDGETACLLERVPVTDS